MNQWIQRITRTDFFIFLLFFISIIAIKLDVLHLPYYWDEIVAYAEPIYLFYNHGFSYFLWPGSNFNHPYGLTLVLGFLFYIFTPSIVLVRVFCLFITAITMFSIYKFGSRQKGLWLGIPAAVIFFFLPEVFTQSSMLVADNILAGYSILFLYFVFRKHYIPALFLGFLMGFTRETAVAFIAPALIFTALSRNLSIKSMLACISPLLGMLLFIVLQKITQGSFFTHAAIVDQHVKLDREWSQIFSLFKTQVARVFIIYGKQSLIYITIFSIVALTFIRFSKHSNKPIFHLSTYLPIILSVLSLYGCFILFFSFHEVVLERYFLPLIPITVIGVFSLLAQVNKYLPTLCLLLIPLYYYPLYQYDGCTTAFATGQEYDMQYISVVKTHLMGTDYVLKNYNSKDLTACTGWPLASELSTPSSGYTNEKVHLNVINGFSDECDLYLWANNMDRRILELKEPLLNEKKIELKKQFVHQCKYYEVYEVLKPASL